MGDLTLESFGISSVPGAEIANMSLNFPASGDLSNVDAKIDGLFDLGPSNDPMDIDYNMDGDPGGSSNFEDLYMFNSQDDLDSGEFNNAYFGDSLG